MVAVFFFEFGLFLLLLLDFRPFFRKVPFFPGLASFLVRDLDLEADFEPFFARDLDLPILFLDLALTLDFCYDLDLDLDLDFDLSTFCLVPDSRVDVFLELFRRDFLVDFFCMLLLLVLFGLDFFDFDLDFLEVPLLDLETDLELDFFSVPFLYFVSEPFFGLFDFLDFERDLLDFFFDLLLAFPWEFLVPLASNIAAESNLGSSKFV